VRDSDEFLALMQIVLEVGNALNAGTPKGNAVGFRMSSLLKLAELRAQDKKMTLLTFTAVVVNKSAKKLMSVFDLLPYVSDAARVPLGQLAGKVEETKKTLELVNKEIEWHTKNPSPIEEDIHLLETLTSFRDRLTEWLEGFTKDLKEATQVFKELCTQFGEENVKEPADFFDTLSKFLVRFEAACKEVDEARKASSPSKQAHPKPDVAQKVAIHDRKASREMSNEMQDMPPSAMEKGPQSSSAEANSDTVPEGETRPKLSSAERRAPADFVDKLDRLASR